MTPTFGNPLDWVVAALEAGHPGAIVTGNPKEMNGFAKARQGVQFVFVQIQGGSTPSYVLQTDVRFEVISYVHDQDDVDPVQFARQLEHTLFLATFDQLVYADGHARRLRTDVAPYTQSLQGSPASLTRCSGTYTIGYRSR